MNGNVGSAAWPDSLDVLAIGLFALAVIGLPLWGHWLMILDVRAYLRALRGALVVVQRNLTHLPAWARHDNPVCLKMLGLRMPCSEEDIKRAYRQRAEQLHPDRGGDRQQFMRLKQYLDQSLQIVRNSR